MRLLATVIVSAAVGAVTALMVQPKPQPPTPVVRRSRTLAELSPTLHADDLASKQREANGEDIPTRTLTEQYKFVSTVIDEIFATDLTEKEAMSVKLILDEQIALLAEAGGIVNYNIPTSFEALEDSGD